MMLDSFMPLVMHHHMGIPWGSRNELAGWIMLDPRPWHYENWVKKIISSGKLTGLLWKITIFNGKTHYSHGKWPIFLRYLLVI